MMPFWELCCTLFRRQLQLNYSWEKTHYIAGEGHPPVKQKVLHIFIRAQRPSPVPKMSTGLTLRLPKPQIATKSLEPLLSHRSETSPLLPALQPGVLLKHIWSQHGHEAQQPTHNNPTVPAPPQLCCSLLPTGKAGWPQNKSQESPICKRGGQHNWLCCRLWETTDKTA